MVSEPGNTSPPPDHGASRPVPPTKPTPHRQDPPGWGAGWWARGGRRAAESPLDAHTAEDDGRVCVCVVSLEGKLCDSVLRRSQKLKTQSPHQSSAWSGARGAGPGTIYGRGHMNHMSTGSL